MEIEEYAKLGCIMCGAHGFERLIGTDIIQCVDPMCSYQITLGELGNIDSIEWEKRRSQYTGEDFVPPDVTRYNNEEQFIENFSQNVTEFDLDGGKNDL